MIYEDYVLIDGKCTQELFPMCQKRAEAILVKIEALWTIVSGRDEAEVMLIDIFFADSEQNGRKSVSVGSYSQTNSTLEDSIKGIFKVLQLARRRIHD